jgi:electron transfer flavoprotein alpha subunit
MPGYSGVMVFGEAEEGRLAVITTELLGCGRRLAGELGQELSCLLVGGDVGSLAREAIAFGADRVYVACDPQLKAYQADACVLAAEEVARQIMPRILLAGQTAIGRDLAPRLAFRLGTALTTDCVELALDPASRLLLRTKPVCGGNALAVFTSEYCPQMATVRAKAMSPLERDDSRQGEVITVEAGLAPSSVRTELVERVVAAAEGVRLEDAGVVICGGRGIGSAEGFRQLEELAGVLKGVVGASRPPCDNGWVPFACQVGLTGKIIAPDLYLAVAISGASQHMTGCSGAKTVVAINRDPEANIFREASYGVVGDWEKILPAFTAKIKELLAD